MCRPAAIATWPISAASPRRSGNIIFDINDFDETHPAPWEWDLKRLAASVYVSINYIGMKEKGRLRPDQAFAARSTAPP